MRQGLRDQPFLGAKEIKEHPGARFDGRRQRPQGEIGKPVAQDITGYFVEQILASIGAFLHFTSASYAHRAFAQLSEA
jgi:hypothetical protein